MIVHQYDSAGLYVGPTEADESPLEPGVYLIPARCTEVDPPAVADDQAARWNGRGWDIITRPTIATDDAVAKLRAFLAANPDVAAVLQSGGV